MPVAAQPVDLAHLECELCGANALTRDRGHDAIARDLAASRRSGLRLTQCDAVDVHRCSACGALFRDPAGWVDDAVRVVERYRSDRYADAELRRLHRVERCRLDGDGDWLRRHGLRRGQRLLEVGSYVGALLTLADAVGCSAAGIDVGEDTSAFTRSLGFAVATGELERGRFPAHSFDAVFVLNCFEQLPDPVATLRELRRLLRRGGSLAIRTPDAEFVRHAHEPARRHRAARCGVLGVPFARCFTASGLVTLLRQAGFTPVEVRGVASPWMDVAARAT